MGECSCDKSFQSECNTLMRDIRMTAPFAIYSPHGIFMASILSVLPNARGRNSEGRKNEGVLKNSSAGSSKGAIPPLSNMEGSKVGTSCIENSFSRMQCWEDGERRTFFEVWPVRIICSHVPPADNKVWRLVEFP